MKKILLNIVEFISEIKGITWLKLYGLTFIIGVALYKVTLNKFSFVPFELAMICFLISRIVSDGYIITQFYFDWKNSKQTKNR